MSKDFSCSTSASTVSAIAANLYSKCFLPVLAGKSTYVRHLLANEKYLEIDLLRNQTLIKYSSNPDILISEVEYILQTNDKYYIFIDEIQKCPKLLDVIHYLLEVFKGCFENILNLARKQLDG
ncbi:MAG: hypothetical protein OMM_11072 [Candidatus Magnetoglobus multicellularis str. Araruama]|uniref:AAA domain-containing protein n=1 Tax=Candidatus Magnetoglobus multicellularis str. Araruama TaxID=890399 RepID=A0A1V1NZD2_9BACT|nr:MAG: hypothetical protein OMM_11072 [Candidatus Magnetoglobus multicellularis str. Araruama]